MSYANDMPTVEMAARSDAGLASELRLSVMRLRRRLSNERHPDNPLSMGAMAVLGSLSSVRILGDWTNSSDHDLLDNVTLTAIPEPATTTLLGAMAVAIGAVVLRRRTTKKI